MKAILLAAFWAFIPVSSDARDIAGRFDYYVLSLSWSPAWCSATGAARSAEQCSAKRDFVVHGLWPQYERGWPANCRTDARDPSRAETRAMGDIMGSGGLAWHQWRKHGRCTGLTARDYFALTREAARRIKIPDVFRALDRDVTLPPGVVEEAFLEANPDLSADGVTITCRGDDMQEVRICLTRDLEPRDCAPDIRRDCPLGSILMEAP